jgi:hypothetical protein
VLTVALVDDVQHSARSASSEHGLHQKVPTDTARQSFCITH